ncbi:MAG: hypothetical protein LQ338_007077 [Usnochroma carphineum]|nr:MAG: hypothetical protein LQ338_007077 [Usnochroma carphineum]
MSAPIMGSSYEEEFFFIGSTNCVYRSYDPLTTGMTRQFLDKVRAHWEQGRIVVDDFRSIWSLQMLLRERSRVPAHISADNCAKVIWQHGMENILLKIIDFFDEYDKAGRQHLDPRMEPT